jgi:type I restriction enzyme R subunit
VSLSKAVHDEGTNIFTDIFDESILRINPELGKDDVNRVFQDVSLALDNEDLGQVFYEMLTATSGIRLIDFENFNNNSFHVVTELNYKNGEDEFRPDVILLINGMPLVFIEVKKPNNHDGILAERNRINARFKNPKFRKFINISQILVFSNNMEYDPDSPETIQGVFYSTTSTSEANFNFFREEEDVDLSTLLKPEDDDLENFVLKDNNLLIIKHSPEFVTNKKPDTPTNRALTSLFSRERLAMLLRYGITYIKSGSGPEKHIMRYPQLFATRAIERRLDEGDKKGIIWHTQGSGKTALAFFNVRYLTDYFHRKGIVPKFYFIVDRIDLMNQARDEFRSRALSVNIVNSKEALVKSFKLKQAIENQSGKPEITVVNIQKFKDDSDTVRASDYDINTQRVYFLDEVHRSYDPKGSFLANLVSSDRDAILIGLTGTPLITGDHISREVFGKYIHKYYYNASIADGYTLRLIREGIETEYKMQLEQALKEIEILKGDADKSAIYAHKTFAEPMLDYIVRDFVNSRTKYQDETIGGMVVCDSSEQARKLYEIFINKYNPSQKTVEPVDMNYRKISEPPAEYGKYQKDTGKSFSASLILHDVGSKDDRKEEVEKFKAGTIDFLFVYNMLLTGFDAKRLKKLYIARLLRDHNLLQMLTRVNRPYKDFKYGFVVDFADIRKNFDATNKAYFEELQAELGNEMETYSNLFKSSEEIENEFRDIKEKLFHYDLNNMENFSQQISQIQDRKVMVDIRKALENARNLYNLAKLLGHYDLLEKIDFKKFNHLLDETIAHIELLNLKESIESDVNTTNLLNVALENVLFTFRKISEDELVIADQLKGMLRKTREGLNANFDQTDPEFVTLYDELKRLFDKKNLSEVTQDDMKQNIGALEKIFNKVSELNRRNNLLKAKYENDTKYARVHKRIVERGGLTQRESSIQESLAEVKKQTDERVLYNNKLMDSEAFFAQMLMKNVIEAFDKIKVALDPDSAKFINGLLVREYMSEYQGL